MNKIDKIKQILDEKVLLFTDLHIGNKSNANSFHEITLQYAEWLKEKALENNINTLLFLGDFFHDREDINLKTLDVANKFLSTLKEFNLILIVGNHDCYYKDNAKIHSLSIFDKWENVTVIDELTTFDYLDKKVTFMPWGFDPAELESGVDYGFGHLTIESFRINKVKVQEKGAHSLSSSELLKKIKKVISGHFHVRSRKNYSGKSITYMGNTFEQNWSDYQEEKGIEIFDFTTGEMEFIENDVSPKHIKVSLAKLLKKDASELQVIKNDFKNNFTRLIVDEEVDSDKLFVISEKLSNLNPLEFNSEMLTSTQIQNADEFDSVEIEMNLLLTEFIEKLDIGKNKDKILEETLSLYEEALTEVKVEA